MKSSWHAESTKESEIMHEALYAETPKKHIIGATWVV